MLRESIDAARRSGQWYSMYYVLTFSGCPLALWFGDLAQVRQYLDITMNRGVADRVRRCWEAILKLRQNGERGNLIAASLEPRLDLSTAAKVLVEASAVTVPVPQPDEDVGDALWSLPEVLRVNAELLLWHNAPGAAAAAEASLLRSIDLARKQSALSWELRSATSLGRLWHRSGRIREARDLLAATYDRFTEGFDTGDVATARRLIADWS
jgi:hypothetical protein